MNKKKTDVASSHKTFQLMGSSIKVNICVKMIFDIRKYFNQSIAVNFYFFFINTVLTQMSCLNTAHLKLIITSEKKTPVN